MKKHIKLILRTLISNNACVEAARTREKKYNIIAVIFALFALFFAAMPTCVTGFQQKGGDWLRGVTYGFDTGMLEFREKASGNTTLMLKENHYIDNSDAQQNSWNNTFKEESTEYLTEDPHRFISMSKDDDHKLLEIFVCWSENDNDFVKYVNNVVGNINPISNGKDEKGNWLETTTDADGNTIKKNRSTSFIVFGHHSVQGALYQPGNTNIASTIYGDYENVKVGSGGVDIISGILVKEGTTPKKIIADCASFFDDVFVNPRRANTWRSTGIILGVDGGVMILMGLMVFILTRGKNNPFRIYSFWDGQKIAYYACLTPGIISLFGFLIPNMAMMLFILGAGVRVMWLSMRTLRYQAPAKQ